jgi:molybdenum cofactor cytidylyltransferase
METTKQDKVGILILAAGESSRLGEPKQLLSVANKTLISRTIEESLKSDATRVIVVLGSKYEEIMKVIAGYSVETVINKDWKKGMGNSLKYGLNLMTGMDAIITSVCDQPFISSNVFNSLIKTWSHGENPVVASSYQGTVGVPALFDQALFKEIESISDLSGAKQLLVDRSIASVAFPEGSIDIDTREDWDDFIRLS